MSDRSITEVVMGMARQAAREEIAQVTKVGPAVFSMLPPPSDETRDSLFADLEAAASKMQCADYAKGLGFDGWTYVISVGVGELTCVKIGKSNEPYRRIRDIQMVLPYRLTVEKLIHGGSLERDLHLRFHAERIHAEWFRGPAVIEWARTPHTALCDGCLWRRAR